jgi:signal transduction histidine kinase
MSHEMRTPTAVCSLKCRIKVVLISHQGVIGMVELLSDDQTLTLEQRDYVNSVQLSAKALLTIVNDILDFSKIESGRLDIEEVPFNISSIVDELVKLLSMFTNQKGLKFIYGNTLDAGLEVLGDPGRTRQVLSNLLTNALKFTKEGIVKLLVSAKPKDSPQAGVDVLEVQFVIEDTGIGIENHVLDKLFRPFSQGDSSTARLYGGTGLGLTISKNVSCHCLPLLCCPLGSERNTDRIQACEPHGRLYNPGLYTWPRKQSHLHRPLQSFIVVS